MTRVKEFVEIVTSQHRRENPIDDQVNKWIQKQERKANPGQKIHIQDIKYHTQYRKDQDDMVHSVLIIWEWSSLFGDKIRHKKQDVDRLAKDLYDEFRGISFGGKTPQDYFKKEPRRHWYSTPDDSWGNYDKQRRRGDK